MPAARRASRRAPHARDQPPRRAGAARGRRSRPPPRSWVTSTTARPSSAPARSSRSTSAPASTSRLPVGSSASRTAGSLTSARAIAKRCCSPPESWCGSELGDRSQPERSISSRRAPRGVGMRAAHARGQQHVRLPAELGQQVEELEDEADAAPAQRASARARRRRSTALAGDARSRPPPARSSPPSRCSSVDLPEPERPSDRHHLARRHLEVDAVEHAARGPALAERLDEPARADRRHPLKVRTRAPLPLTSR